MRTAVIAILLAFIGLVGGCAPGSHSTPTGSPPLDEDAVTLSGQALAGPVCPVETVAPDPDCDSRPVADAVIVVRNAGGDEVATLRADAEGRFSVDLAPGSYEVVPQQVDGLMQAAASVEVDLEEGTELEPLVLAYDTGIR